MVDSCVVIVVVDGDCVVMAVVDVVVDDEADPVVAVVVEAVVVSVPVVMEVGVVVAVVVVVGAAVQSAGVRTVALREVTVASAPWDLYHVSSATRRVPLRMPAM